jgi:hypothetical protein
VFDSPGWDALDARDTRVVDDRAGEQPYVAIVAVVREPSAERRTRLSPLGGAGKRFVDLSDG